MRFIAWSRSRTVLTIAVAAWLGAVASGFAIFQRYESTPGSAGTPNIDWPADSPILLESNRLTLVLAIHPRCPCSAATVEVLERVLGPRPGRAKLNVLLFKPANEPASWASSSTSRALADIADTQTWLDDGGREATRFGAVTSGQLLIYDAGGRLRFAGGITAVRGQSGANAASVALEALLDDRHTELKKTPVYGCSLLSAPTQPKEDR
jgi:hypothetical protein